MKAKIFILGLICFFIFACKSPADPEIKKALNPVNKVEEGAKTQITFNLDIQHCGVYPPELEDLAWYQIFEVYINDGIGTYGDGLLIHTHEFGRGEGFYYELPERYYRFIPALDFPGTRTRLGNAYNRTSEFDFEVWFYLKESNIPSDLIGKLTPRILIDVLPVESGFECIPFNLDSFCLNDIYHPDEWIVGERTVSSPDNGYNRLHFRVMISDD